MNAGSLETNFDLVDRFERNVEAYTSGHYNETQLRREFLDPFFKALGWDVANEQGHAEAYRTQGTWLTIDSAAKPPI